MYILYGQGRGGMAGAHMPPGPEMIVTKRAIQARCYRELC